ncbi:MAG TPA: general secretion pathway protein GspB [Gammaproteobacteria bacterium]|nr:general secretion pathway protein GspB [Gammaproteobacteria bacterium]
MSLLLDALKRSEQERQQTLKDRLGQAGPAPGVARKRAPWVLAIVMLLSINAALVIVWLRPVPSPATVVHAVPSAPLPQPDVRSLATEAALAAPIAVDKPAVTAEPAKESPSSSPFPPAAAKGSERVDADEAPALDTLPEPVRQGLPALHMQIHVYADNPADRFVMINMHRYVEGDTLAAGPKVIRIRPDGVVLRYRGRSFLLPRR